MYAPFYLEDDDSNLIETSVYNGSFSIGEISNLTGALVGKNVTFTGSYKAISIGTGYSVGQSGTFDLELTGSNGQKIIVTFTITIGK
ncbi:hypothetical protein [Lysinibacillus boronitolerans]|uniref:Uncharacterized protein n=1 Tax=Lysinibacillus boronitolerans JCM 21713 = 10a = NBRC 103108 TaxID=1294264 RepID=A0ABR4Y5S7_9BACI|nr:hypothetical protein [Lysinibacillus boronitolerans]KGR89944.1 hypothetical protein CD31_00155 [Lysinibacillus boronitolerans JCM 21713 = 10a = NBRC 103108]